MFTDGLKYQESHMEKSQDFIKDLAPFAIKDFNAVSQGGPVLFRQGNIAYTDPSEAHSLIMGDTGSMKTLRFVLPLIRSSANAGESMVIVDPKGELARKSKKLLQEKGYQTYVLNLRNPGQTEDCWNPLGIAKRSFEEERYEESNIQINDLLEKLFFTRTGKDKDPYWNDSAGQFALGICQLLQLKGIPLTIKNLLNWRYSHMDKIEMEYRSLPKECDIVQNLAGYLDLTAANTKSCIMSTFDQLVRPFKSSPALTEMLTESTFQIEEIGCKKTAVFLIVPDEKTTFHFLATLFISQCYSCLLEKAEEFEGSLPIRVNFILEEFCNMPKLEDMLAMLTAARSRNIRFHLVVQSYSQLMEKYGENATKTIVDNCGNLIYLHSREMSFLRYVSELAGNNEYGRPLLSTSRLQHLQKNETIIFHERCYPFIAKDIPLIFEYAGGKIKTQ